MDPSIVEVLTNSSGAVVVASIAFYYFARTAKEFTQTIDKYLTESIKSSNTLSSRLQEFSDANKELREVIQKLYTRLYEEVKSKRKSN